MGTDLIKTGMDSSALAPNSPVAAIISRTRDERDLSDEDFAALAIVASGPPPVPAIATYDQIKNLIGVLAGHLDKRKTSIDIGRLNLKIYYRMLGNLPLSTLQKTTEEALATLQWMPEASVLLKIAKKHIASEVRLHARAQTLVRLRQQRLFDETLVRIRKRDLSTDELQTIDDHLADVAQTRGDIVIRVDGNRQYRTKEIIQAHLDDLKKQRRDKLETRVDTDG